MDLHLFKKLRTEGLITDDSLQNLTTLEERRLFSLHWELKTLLYIARGLQKKDTIFLWTEQLHL